MAVQVAAGGRAHTMMLIGAQAVLGLQGIGGDEALRRAGAPGQASPSAHRVASRSSWWRYLPVQGQEPPKVALPPHQSRSGRPLCSGGEGDDLAAFAPGDFQSQRRPGSGPGAARCGDQRQQRVEGRDLRQMAGDQAPGGGAVPIEMLGGAIVQG
ncbi:MAG: hypothetical protein IPJ99_00710 [Betaproteobacteria bacterium]|nr:hypothetical protein [Betaproteobacteria bacterium]